MPGGAGSARVGRSDSDTFDAFDASSSSSPGDTGTTGTPIFVFLLMFSYSQEFNVVVGFELNIFSTHLGATDNSLLLSISYTEISPW